MTTIDTTLRLLAVLLLIAGNAVFCAGEFALVTVDRGRVEAQAEAGSRRSKLVLSLLRQLAFQLSSTQLGITLTSIVLGFIAEPVIGDLLGPVFGRFALAAALITATVAELLGDGRVRLDITAEVDSVGVLGNATAVVRLPA